MRGPAGTESARGPRPSRGIISRKSASYHGGQAYRRARFAVRTWSRYARSFVRSATQGSFPDISGDAPAETKGPPTRWKPPNREYWTTGLRKLRLAPKKEYLPAATVLCAHEQNFVEQGSIGFGLPHAVAKRGSAGLAWSAYGPEMQSRCF